MPAGNAYPSEHVVPSPFWDLLMLKLLGLVFPNLPGLFSTLSLEYPSVLSRFCFAFYEFSVGIGTFVIGLSQTSSHFSFKKCIQV